MDTRVPADDGGLPSPAAASGPGPHSVEQRLAAIEARLDSLEHTMRETVTEELHTAGDELRRAVSDLGRLLLRDLDRLTKVLAEHRDAIVDRLTAVAEPAPEPLPAPVEPAVATAVDIPAEPDSKRGEEGRWRALPGRRKARRSPQDEPGGDTRDSS
ncbi:MAG: hypothetical protein ACRD2W_01900 [Acidimicrobiales bacterium]